VSVIPVKSAAAKAELAEAAKTAPVARALKPNFFNLVIKNTPKIKIK
jgi:hypothetical protein